MEKVKTKNVEENILGTEKIGKLMKKFAIPCIVSLLVNSLYNIVDQIFIGWGVGYLGNGATNVVFPFTVIALAFSLMFGDGAAAYLSLKLGEKKAEKEINRINKLRANHYKHYTDKEWAAHENYDICINSDTLGVEKAAELICNIVNDDKVIV